MAFDLRDFRENKLKMTQEEFAVLLDERQDKVSRWEADPGDIPARVLERIARKTGQTIDELVGYEKPRPEPVPVKDTWQGAELVKQTLVNYLDEQEKGAWDAYEKSGEFEAEYRGIIRNSLRKPRVAFIGQYATGKSTLVNALLGVEVMSTSWTSTTSIIVYIKHISDRPDYIRETTWIFRDEDDKPFDPSCLNDSKMIESLKIAQGDIEILRQSGTGRFDRYSDEAAAAVVFVDSDILKNVDLVDFPGFGTDDGEAASRDLDKMTRRFDVLVYLMAANVFMRGNDISYLRQTIPLLPFMEKKDANKLAPLGNLFILASQAHIADNGNKFQLQMILDNAYIRFEQALPDTLASFFEARTNATGYNIEKYFRERFFTYATDIPELRKDFEDNIRTVMEQLPEWSIEMTKELLKTYVEDCGKALDITLESYDLLKNKEKEKVILAELLKNEPARQEENNRKRNSIIQKIRAYNEDSRNSFMEKYKKTISVDNIVKTIKERGFKNKKEDREALANNLSAQLEDTLRSILLLYSSELKSSIDDYIAGFRKACEVDGKLNVNVFFVIEAIWVFTSGLAGMAVIGGPVMALAFTVMFAFVAFGILSAGWEKSTAKALVKAYEKESILEKYLDIIENFWLIDTIDAFNSSADSMEEAWQEEIEKKMVLLNNYDEADIQRRIEAAEKFRGFLSNIPL